MASAITIRAAPLGQHEEDHIVKCLPGLGWMIEDLLKPSPFVGGRSPALRVVGLVVDVLLDDGR